MADSKKEYSKSFLVSLDFKKSLKEFGTTLQKDVSKFGKNILTEIKQPLLAITNTIMDSFKNGIQEMKDMIDYSQLSSSYTRELALRYGFSSSQAYGWDKALSAVGLESEEDLFYANSQELKQFREAFEKYSNYYSELYDSGFFETLQDYQFEMNQFTNDIKLEVVRFFIENKDVIKSGMVALMDISKQIVALTAWLVGAFGQRQYATTSDVINNWGTSSTKNNNININNTFNGVGKEDETWLANSGTLTYQQVIRSLKN